jgi:acetyl-CoA acetyltransferase
VAELSATFSHEELILRAALGLGDDVEVNPSGGALAGHPLMATGLIRIGEAFRQINQHGRRRTLGHATSGPCLQQNLICLLEGDD